MSARRGTVCRPLERPSNTHFISSESPIEIDCAKSATVQIIRVFLRRGNIANRPTIQIPLLQTVNTLNLLIITEITGFNTKKISMCVCVCVCVCPQISICVCPQSVFTFFTDLSQHSIIIFISVIN